MGLIGSAANAIYAFKFLRLLTKKWSDTEAYKLGIVDRNGTALKRVSELKTDSEKNAYNVFNRLVFNIKRTLDKVGIGKSRIGTYASALYLLKEETGLTDDQILEVFEELGVNLETDLQESKQWFVLDSGCLSPGTYTLTENIMSPLTHELVGMIGQTITVAEDCLPITDFMGVKLYTVKHNLTGHNLTLTASDIKR